MAKKSSSIHVCDKEGHHDDIAVAFCKYHKKLLCSSCLVEKTKAPSPDCSIMTIKDAEKEEDIAILNCLSIKQNIRKKHNLIEKHEEKVDKIKTELQQKVEKTHANILTRLNDLREKCLKSINEQVLSITKVGKSNNERLKELEATLNDYIEMLSAEKFGNCDEIISKINDTEEEINTKIPDKVSIPQGEFRPNEAFNSFIMQSGTSIGKVNVIDPDDYEEIENKSARTDMSTASDEVGIQIKKDTIYSRHGTTGRVRSPLSSPGHNIVKKRGFLQWLGFQKEKTDQWKGKSDEKVTYGNEKRLKDKTRPESASIIQKADGDIEEIYKDSTFIQPTYKPPKYLINKIINVDMKFGEFTSACKFSKMVGLGTCYIGLLSEVHKTLIFVGTEGQFLGSKHFKDASNVVMTAIGKADVAVLLEPSCVARKFRVSEKGFETTGSFKVEDISNITGFDYDLSSSTYAVSSSDKTIILDKAGKVNTCVQYGEKARNIVTTFDFKNECLYILNRDEKILKSFSIKTSNIIWTRKMDSVACKAMVLYRDKICLACNEVVAIFSVEKGKPIIKHEIGDLFEECVGLCVIDGVLVISSDSDDKVKSASFAYISL